MQQSPWNVILFAVMGAYLVIQGYLLADVSATSRRLDKTVTDLQTRIATLESQSGGGGGHQGGGDGQRVSTDGDGADRPRNKPPLNPPGGAPQTGSKPPLKRPATVMVKLLARIIVLEYRGDTSMTDAQAKAAKALLTAYHDKEASDVDTNQKFEALLTEAQRAYLEKEREQIDLKTSELLEISGKDDNGYAELALDFLDKPIRPDTTGAK